jgi:hypothetical protein
MKVRLLSIVGACLCLCQSASAQGTITGDEILELLAGRLEIGLRMTTFDLDTTTSRGVDRNVPGDTFLGNLTRIDEEQSSTPKLFFVVMPHPYVGVELAWDGVEARTWNVNNEESDGKVCASGPIFSLVGRYPNETRFTPFASLGYTFWDADFDEDGWWRYGFGSSESYIAAGRPGNTVNGIERRISVSIDNGVVWTAGCSVSIIDHLSADVIIRSVDVSVDAAFYRTVGAETELRRTGGFPLDHVSYGLGVKYVF